MVALLVPAYGPLPWVMGVVNVTPDSFSDGGRWLDTAAAVRHGEQLFAEGAALVDVGGESTRPGAHRVDADTEKARVLPVIAALSRQGIYCSVDTSRAAVAAAAVQAGAVIVNDVSGGMADRDMVRVVAEARVPWIIMHWRGPSDIMGSLAHYTDVVSDVREELLRRVDVAVAGGIDPALIILDPGLGFAKTTEHNWALLRDIHVLVDEGFPILVGASRKRFLGELLALPDGSQRPTGERESATAAISLVMAQRGVWGVRVHDVIPTMDSLKTLAHLGPASRPAPASQPLQAAAAGALPDTAVAHG